jgi:hypothetical protein
MSMSDARLFADLTQRVENLEKIAIRQQALLEELEEHVTGKDVHEEIMGPPPDMAARDSLRTMQKEMGARILEARQNPTTPPVTGAASVDPAPDNPIETAPGLREKLAALQGGEAAAEPSKPSPTKK